MVLPSGPLQRLSLLQGGPLALRARCFPSLGEAGGLVIVWEEISWETVEPHHAFFMALHTLIAGDEYQ